jgi:hypothetical protein
VNNGFQQKGFFAARGLALQTSQNPGCTLFAPLRSRGPRASAKICYALPAHMATIVLPDFTRSFSAEEKEKNNSGRISLPDQKRVKACQKSGPGCFACGLELFSGLIFFGPFLYQDKKGLATAAIERTIMI